MRQYERENLINPSRSDGRIRLYSQRDIDKIKLILRLTRELGVNLAGVDIILQLKDKIAKLEAENESLNIAIMEYKYKNGVNQKKNNYGLLVNKKEIEE